MLECLHVRPEIGLFEPLLRETAERVAALEDERFARVRAFEREGHALVVVSELVSGERLGDILDTCRNAETPVAGLDAALGFLLQALPALARLHAAGMTHGAVAPGRIIITPTSQVVLLDPLYGEALERLRLNRHTLWMTLSIMSPPAAGAPRFDARLDVGQVALAALALALGRPITAEAPPALTVLLDEVSEVAQIRGGERFAESVRLLFTTTLPSSVQGRGALSEAAAADVQRLAREIGEDTALAALADLVRSQRQEPETTPTPVRVKPTIVEAAPQMAAPPPAITVVPPPPAAPEPVAAEPTVTAPMPPPVRIVLPTLASAPAAEPVQTPVALTATAAPAPLRIRTRAPAGYAPPRVASDGPVLPRALPFVQRGPSGEGPTKFPWKLAAAAVLVTAIGVVAGRAYLHGGSGGVPARLQPISAPAKTPITPTGSLSIESQPAGARVALNGVDVGVTPVVLDSVAPGRHVVTLTTDVLTVRRTVKVDEGKRATLDIPVFSGWIAVFAPITLHVSKGTQSLGTTETGRILLPPGRHVLTFASKEFGFSTTQPVEIAAGEERAVNLDPKGPVNLNAHPWAEVWVDGARAGETPLANLQVPLGTREFIFRHPQHGERKLTTTITTAGAALSVDFTKPGIQP